jgi:quercetin dioxygenase-like cupin family protein
MSTRDVTTTDAALEQFVFESLGAVVQPASLDTAALNRMRARILQSVRPPEPPPTGTATFSPAADGWVDPAPNVRMKWLRKDEVAGTQEVLIRLGPGAVVPEHSHNKEEHMVILDGELHLGSHLLRQGDVHIAPPGSWHPPITTERGVLMLLRCEYPFPVG